MPFRLFRRPKRTVRPASRWTRSEPLEPRLLLTAQLVKDLVPGSDGGQPSSPVALGEKLIFSTGGVQPGLWASDGTDAGTVRIAEVPIVYDSYEGRSPAVASTAHNLLFFNGPGGLWKTDGTAAGAALVKALDAFYGGNAYDLTQSGDVVYFTTKDAWYGEELWRTDGTQGGTVMVADLYPGRNLNGQNFDSLPRNLTDVNGTLFFSA